MECVATEIIANFPEHTISIETKRLDLPESLNATVCMGIPKKRVILLSAIAHPVFG